MLILFLIACFAFTSSYEYSIDESKTVRLNNTFPLNEINRLQIDDEIYVIGTIIDDSIIENRRLLTPFFELNMRDIDAFENETTIIGWNHKKIIIFISTVSTNAQTGFGIKIGDTKETVLSMYGEPSLKSDNRFRYDNYDFEFEGTVLYFKDNMVYRITCFATI